MAEKFFSDSFFWLSEIFFINFLGGIVMKKIFGVIALIFFLIATLGIFYFQISQAKNETVENWGMADAKEINVNSKISGRILEIFVDEGDAVKKIKFL